MTSRIKPELKIILFFLFVAVLFVFEDLTVYLFVFALLGLFSLKMPLKILKSGWIPISVFLLFTFVSNVIGRQGRVVFSAGQFMVTGEGIHIAAARTLRLFLMIGGAKVLMFAVKAEEMVDGLGRLFCPLEKVGLPVRDFFHTMGLTLKCFPVLKNMAAETYRENMRSSDIAGFWGRARLVSASLLPLFVKSLQSPEAFFEQKPVRTAGTENNLRP